MSDDTGKNLAIVFGAMVYIGGVILATSHAISLYSAGAETQWQQLLATMGAVLVGLNAIALPVAMHKWAVSGVHKWAAIIAYAVDLLMIAANAIADTSIAQNSEVYWLFEAYKAYAAATFVVPVVSWGLLFATDPGNRAERLVTAANQAYDVQAAQIRLMWLQTPEGRAKIARKAAAMLDFGEYGLNALNAPQQAALPVIDVPSTPQPAKVSRLAMLKAAMTGRAPAVFAQDVQQAQPPAPPAEPANPTPAA